MTCYEKKTSSGHIPMWYIFMLVIFVNNIGSQLKGPDGREAAGYLSN